MPSDADRLRNVLLARHACVSIATYEEAEALEAVRHASMALNRPLWLWSASGGVQEGLFAESPALAHSEDPLSAFGYFAARERQPICALLDLGPALRNEKVLRGFRNLLNQSQKSGTQYVLVSHDDDLPPVIRSYCVPFELSPPNDDELESIVRNTLRREHDLRPIEIDIGRKTLHAIVRNLRGLTRRQAEAVVREIVCVDRRFDDADLEHVVAAKRRALGSGGLLEFIETPAELDAIGGLRRLKTWLKSRENSLTQHAFDFGLPTPRGVLMLGVQGAGKSLCAKAIATAWRRPLLRLEVGALYDRYVGETERRLRDALRQAGSMAPAVLWIDEIEKAFASAASRSTDGGLSQRMFGALLTWMQEREEPLFLVATANDIEALPPELLRKGRFDEIFFVDLPTADVRREIFAIHIRRRKRDPATFDLPRLAQQSDGFSGAEIEQAIVASMHAAFEAGKDIDTDTILSTLRGSPPLSVTMAERIAALREWADGRCVPAD